MELFQTLEAKHGLPAGLLDAVWATESSRGKNLNNSSAGARGHFQFMPETAKQYGIYGKENDLTASATAASRMYSDLLRQSGGNLDRALAGYNWGSGNVQRKGMQNMPAETRNYIHKVRATMGAPQQQQRRGMPIIGMQGQPAQPRMTRVANDDPFAALRQKYGAKQASAVEQQPAQQQDDPFAALREKYSAPAAQPAPQELQAAPMAQPAQQPAQAQQGNKRGFAAEIARQFGLTSRYALEGGAQALEVFSEPMRYVTDRVLGGAGKSVPASELARRAADAIGLPQPENKLERVVGDGTRMGFGAMLPMGLANKFAPLAKGNVAKAIVAGVAENPAAQIGGGVGSGLASGAVREHGGGQVAQTVAGIAGGIAGGAAGNRVMRGVAVPAEYVANRLGVKPLPQTMTPRKMDDMTLASVLRNKIEVTGGNWDELPIRVKQSIMADVRKANNLDNLDAQALRRLTDFRALGVTPTRGTVTLDPAQITREKNLAKAGANSRIGGAQGLAQVENANNNRLVQLLQGVEGGNETEAITAGRGIVTSIVGKRDALRNAEQAAWDAAKGSPTYHQPIDSGVLSNVNQALGDSAMMPFMDSRISSYITALQQNPEQWTPAAYRNLQSMLAKAARTGGNEGAAAGIARNALENANWKMAGTQFVSEGLPVTQQVAKRLRDSDGAAQGAIDFVEAARKATRAAYEYEGSSAVVKAALSDGADPTRLANRFVINGTPDEAATVRQNLSPEGLQAARNAIATYIKKKALGGASDEVGNVSQKSLNSTINAMGDAKLRLFFTKEEVDQLRRIGRVASYTQVQPSGSAVNNSNSGALLLGKGFDLITGITGKIPLLNIDQQVDSLLNIGRTRSAMDAAKGIYTMPQNRFGLLPSAARGGFAGGLLVSPRDSENDRKRN